MLRRSWCRLGLRSWCDDRQFRFRFFFRLRLSLEEGPGGPQMLLSASHPLEGVVMSVALPDSEQLPSGMRASDGRGVEWRIGLDAAPSPAQRIRLVARAAGSSYFGDASTAFLLPGDNPAN